MYREAVRVATTNNFNCTPAEWKQLDEFAKTYPNSLFFVNSNARTPLLHTIADHPYPAVVTVNPDLEPDPRLERRALALPADRIAFLRAKWLPDRKDILSLILRLQSAGRTVVVVPQRFRAKAVLLKFSNPDRYHLDCSRFRLHGPALDEFLAAADRHGFLVCDRSGAGCRACGQCAQLSGAGDVPVKSLNLSTSGECPYACPDCYAKQTLEFIRGMGNQPVYDKVKANDKQAGRTTHIKRALQEA